MNMKYINSLIGIRFSIHSKK